MSRWTGSWLSGPPASAGQGGQQWRGERLGLPREGAGSVASSGRKLVALLVDFVLASLVTALFVHPDFMQPESMKTHNYWSVLTWFLITVVATGFFGFTPGMALLGIRVARIDGSALLGPIRAMVRAALVAIIVPAVIWDVDNRGLHDKAAGTVVVRLR